jgi:uncharacterized protein YjbI with pentapeptide repeats
VRATAFATWAASARRGLGAAALGLALVTPPAAAAALTPEQAYGRLAAQGRLSAVEVVGDVDLARLPTPPGGAPQRFEFDRVVFRGRVHLVAAELRPALVFQQTTFQDLDVRDARIRSPLTCDACRMAGSAILEGTTFEDGVRVVFTQFLGKTSFGGSRFRGDATFTGSAFHEPAGLTGGVNFGDVVFARGARFDDARFTGTARFNSTVFGGDATFLKLRVDRRALFRNTIFEGDAEFRHCQLGDLDFGGHDALSVFQKLADFRGCRIERAVFDYAVFRAPASFVQAQFGAGGASFRSTAFEGDRVDFNQVRSQGALNLNDTYMPRVDLRWRELGPALLAAQPPPDMLSRVHRRLTELGRSDEALDVYYHYAMSQARAQLSHPGLPASERAWRAVELGVWGWPTGYGTRLGRIVLVSLVVWAVLTFPVLAGRITLIRLPTRPRARRSRGAAEPPSRRAYEPMLAADVPTGAGRPTSWLSRGWTACLFTFGLMFRIPVRTIAYIEPGSRPGRHGWERYFMLQWVVGALLLGLVALTLANISPALKALVGHILV